MTELQEQKISAALEKVFRHYSDAGPMNKDQRTRDFVFHMTDWYEDLMRLAALYADPAAHDQKKWNEQVFAFLVHAVGHLLAAAKLSDVVIDPFGALKAAKPSTRKTTRKPSAKRAA